MHYVRVSNLVITVSHVSGAAARRNAGIGQKTSELDASVF